MHENGKNLAFHVGGKTFHVGGMQKVNTIQENKNYLTFHVGGRTFHVGGMQEVNMVCKKIKLSSLPCRR